MIRQSRLANFALIFLAMLLFLVFVSDDSEAATYTVDEFGGSDYTNITQAVDNASAGDTIKVAARTYHDAVEVDKRLTILGSNEGFDAGSIFDPSCNSGELVARYTFDENGGSDVYDGVWCDDLDGDVEGASWTTGVWESGLDFDGSNDYIEVDHDSAFNLTDAITIAAWINLESNNTGAQIVSTARSDSNYGYSFKVTGDELYFQAGTGSGHIGCDSGSSLSTDKWYHVVVTYDRTSIKFYVNGEKLSTECNYDLAISSSTEPLKIGAWKSGGQYFDGTIDDVGIWNIALSASNIQGLHWSGDGTYYPIVNASEGGYSFKITADDVVLKKFEVQYSGDDAPSAHIGDAGVWVSSADDAFLDKIRFKYNTWGIRLAHAEGASIFSSQMSCDSEHEYGILNYESDNIKVHYGNYDCTTEAGIYNMYSEGGEFNFLSLYDNERGIYFLSGSEINQVSNNYINSTTISETDDVGLYFESADNNTVYNSDFNDNKYAIKFNGNANDNIIKEVDFSDSDTYDIVSSGDSWENVLIDTEFDDLSISSTSRLLEKTLIETTITDNGTYYWNRVNSTIDSDRRSSSGTNSFWAGDSEEDEYGSNWDVTFKMTSDVSLPGGGVENSSILDIRTWYKTEQRYDGGRVYITKDAGTSWNLLTPLGGYDALMYDGSSCDNDEKAFTGEEDSWQNKKFNLSGYRGEDVRIKFVFCSDDSQEMEGWYIDDVKIYKDSDTSAVYFSDDFERLGHMWVDARDWTHEGNPRYEGKRDVDVVIIEGTSSAPLVNLSINNDMLIYLKMDESSGNALDSVSSQWWSRYGNSAYGTGLYGNAITFDGSGDYLRSSYDYVSSSPWRLDEITISAWVKFDTFPSGTDVDTVVSTDREGQFRLQVNSSGNPRINGYFYSPNGEQNAISDTALVTDVWYHLAATWSETSDAMKLYVNGTLVDTYSFSATTPYLRTYGSYMYVGRDYNGHYMDGTVDNVQLWTDDFNSREIKAIYDNPINGPYLYSTLHYGGSDGKTNSDGKLDDIYVTTKIYDGSSSGANVDTYIGLRYGDWTREISKITIDNNKLESKVFDFRVYNRNKDKLYYGLGTAVDGASSGNTIEVWPGLYKENVVVSTKVAIVGSGISRTIIDARYKGPAIKFNNYLTDHSSVKNLRVMHAPNSTSTCQSSGAHGGSIYSYYSDYLTIQNVHFYDTHTGFMNCYGNHIEISNSTFDRGSVSSYLAGIYMYGGYKHIVRDNEITKFTYGLYTYYDTYGSYYYNNYIHNNTSIGIYIYFSGSSSYSSDPNRYVKNRIVDNNYGVYRGDTSSTYGRYIVFKDNLVKSSTTYGVYCYYYCQDWKVENNTFDGDDDTTYGWYSYRYQYRTEFGNNTFKEHNNKDIYLLYCGTGSSANKFFYNTYSSIAVSSSCQVDIYNNLNVKTVEEDSDAFSNVEIEIKDSSKTFYETPHWGGSDALTDTNGLISNSMMIRSGYYSSSSTLTSNNITVNIAYGVRAKSTWILFDEDTTESITVPDAFRFGVVKNTNTSTIYTSFSSAISAASDNNILNIWAWTYNENFVVNKGVTIIGNSTASSIINGGSGDYAIEVKSNDVTIKNLTLNGASDSLLYAGNYNSLNVENVVMTSSSSDYGIYFDRTKESTITGVTVNDTDRKSVFIDDGDTITFKNSYFMNASSSNGFEISDSEDIILDNVFIYNSGYNGSSSYGLYITSSDKVTVKGSTKVGSSKSYELYANDATNLKIHNSTFTGKNLALIEESDDFLIENSVFKDTSSGDYGVYIKNTNSAIFKFNTVKNSASDSGSDYGSIYLTNSQSNSIFNNTITNSGRSGIHLKSSSDSTKIYGNTVSGSNYHGLYVQSSDSVLIRNNTFSSSTDKGIKISSSDNLVVDNNTLSSNSDYGIYVSSADNLVIKSNSISDNNAGAYVTGSDDVVISSNTVDDQTTYGIYLSNSERLKIKKNIVKNSLSDALVLSSNCDNAFVDNNTIKNNGDDSSGRAVRLYEVEDTVLYNNSIESNDYTGLVITSSIDNKIIHNIIKGNGKYGIQISNDFIISANNTIKDNTVNDNEQDGMYIAGIYTKIINNTVKYNEKDGIHILDAGARVTIQQNTVVDNEDSAVRVLANHGTVTLNTINGDTSSPSVVVVTGQSVIITNNTIEGGSQGIKVQNSINAFIYNNTIEDNSDYGIYLLLGAISAEVKSNIVKDNGDVGIYISGSNSTNVKDNTIKDNDKYGIFAGTSRLVDFESNTIEENGGGVKFSDCDYCNLTSVTIKDNGGRGVWFVDSDNNYIKHVTSKDSNDKDVYFQGSLDNTAFNFTFSTIFINSTSTLTITSNLEIVFQDSSSDGFQGIDFALLTKGVKVYSTPFYGGSDAVSDSDGEAGATFSLDYRIYNRSDDPTNIANVLKYHYGVRSKEKSIDMSTSHTETVTVPSFWVKGLVKNTNSGSTWYKIQDAIDNASSGNTLHIWAWNYNENVEVDESITIIGNGTGNTTLNATSSGKGFSITSDDVTIRNIKVEGCGSTNAYNGFQLIGDDITIENVIATTCYRGVSIEGSGAWVGNSTFSNNYNNGIDVFVGDSSTTAVKIYKNNIWWNANHGIKASEDDVVIKSNIIRNNTADGIYLDGAADSVIDGNTIVDNDDGITVYNGAPRVLIKDNTISDSDKRGISVTGSSSHDGVIESNTVTDNGHQGILIQHSDYYYLGNTSVSGSGTYDIHFHKTTIGNSAKNTTFSTIYVNENAYFAIYNDLTLKFMQNATLGFENLDVKLVSDGSNKYVTSYYGGSDSKTDSNGSISKDFTLKFRIYNGSSTPDEATTTLHYHYGVRAKAYNINMTTSHTETVIVPSYWKQGLIKNLDTGLQSSTIQDAIDNASSGDRLQLWEWDYVEYGIEVTERITIFGNSSSVTVSGNNQDDVFILKTNSITLKNLTIEESGTNTDDACIDISSGSSIKVDNVILKDCNIGILVETSNVVISNVTIQDAAKDGIIVKASSVTIENSTIEDNGRNGIELHANTIVYNNTIKENQKDGINITANSNYAKILSNTIEDNDDQGISIYDSHHVTIKNNDVEDNDYGILLQYANFTQINNNNIKENDIGGIKFVSTKYSNITSSIFKNNNGNGIWFTLNSDSNNIRDSVSSGSSINDIALVNSKKNTGFNFTFAPDEDDPGDFIDVDSDSDFRIMNSLNIKFVNGSTAFAGVELELFNYDTVLYASPFYGGNDGASGSDGFIDSEFTVAYEIYNGSSTTEDVQTFLKYSYGVRGKQIEIDMSTSHTETVDVPSFWTKGLVRHTDTDGVSTDYYKIQDAIDNASAGDILHIWAWTYYETIEIDEKLTIIGNGTANTTINATSSGIGFDIEVDDVTIRNLEIVSCGNTGGNNGIQADSDDAIIENVRVSKCHKGISVGGSGVWIGNSTITNNYDDGIYVYAGDSSTSPVKIYNNTITLNADYGIYNLEDDLVIKFNKIRNNIGNGIGLRNADDAVISHNTVSDNKHNIAVEENSVRVLIAFNLITDATSNGIYFHEPSSQGIFESNTIKDSEYYGISIVDSDDFYFGNNTISGSGTYDLRLNAASDRNVAVNTTFSTIYIHQNSDLMIKEYFVLDVNDASGANMSSIDIKVMEDDVQKYASSYFGGSDPKTDSYGTIETFLIDYKKYAGSSTPTTVPIYVTARSNDWVETFTSNPSSTIQITVPDLRVQNTRTGTLTYHIQTSIDDANEGDTIRAWNGTYFESIEITEEVTIIGNGTFTIIDGGGNYQFSGNTTFEVKEDSITIKNLKIINARTGIFVSDVEDTVITNIKFESSVFGTTYAIHSEDSQDLIVNNSIFDVDDYGIYLTGSSGVFIIDNEFRNGTSSDGYCIYQSESSDNGGANIENNKFNDCTFAWKSGSNSNTFKDNTLKDNEYGVLLSGTEANNNLLYANSFDDSGIAVSITNTAYDNNLYDNFFDDSEDYDIYLSDSYDTVSYNNTFSDVFIASDANMWIKVYIDVDVTDNSSNALSNVDLEIKQDNLVVYSTVYFGGSDSRTNATGQISEFLVATSRYNGSSTPTSVTTTVNARYSDWISSDTYNINNDIVIKVDDFRVKNDDSDQMFYSINGAINAASNGDTLLIWAGTYYENVVLNKELTLTGNGTSATIINGSYSGNVITVTVDEVLIEDLAVVGSGSSSYGISISEGDSVFTNLRFADNNVSYFSSGDFNEISSSTIVDSNFGVIIEGDNNIVSQNTFSENAVSIRFSTSEDSRANNNEITDGTTVAIQLDVSEEITIRDNYIHNNSAYGITITNSSSDNEIYDNDLEYNSEYSVHIVASGNNSIHNNTFKSNDEGAAKFDSSYYNVFRDNTLNANDDYLLLEGGGQNSILHNTFTEEGILIQNSNNQIIIGNTITDARDNGIRIFKSSSNNYLSDNSISESDDEDIYVGGSGSQINNRGFNNSFDYIKVQGNGEFIVLDYIGLRTINANGNMSGNDVKATFGLDTLYASSYFGGSDPVTDSNGLIPDFIAPIEIYDGSSTPTKVITPMTVRYSDWIETFDLDPYSGEPPVRLIVPVPDLRVKNQNTGEWSYLIQTAIDDPDTNVNDVIILSNSTYFENVIVHKPGLTLQGPLADQHNPGVIIDAQNNGCAITITRPGVSILGLNVTNSAQDTEFFNSSGIRLQSLYNEIKYNKITNSYVGIYLDESLTDENNVNNEISYNLIDDVDIGILLTSSNKNMISLNHIDSVDSNDIVLSDIGYEGYGSESNIITENIDIDSMKIENSDGNSIVDSEITTITLVNSESISSISSEFDYVICDSDSSLYLKNYMNVNVSRLGSPLQNVDIRVKDGDAIVYSTSYFGGSDPKTTSSGSFASNILVIYGVYNGSSTAIGNETSVKVRIGDWFKLSQDTIEDYTVFDFNVPHFRVENTGTSTKYAYVQTAIDNATAGHTILLEAGIYHENIVIDKELTLSGSMGSDFDWYGFNTAIITVDDTGGLGAPPVANLSRAGITVSADNVNIESLLVANFTYGIYVEDSEDVDITNVIVVDTQVTGISMTSSTDVSLSYITVREISQSTDTCVDIGDTVNFVEFSISAIHDCDIGISVAGDNVGLDSLQVYSNSNDGIKVTATASNLQLNNNVIHDNGGNGIDVSGLTSGSFYDNTIYDNGNTEFRIVSSYNLEIYDNTISDSEFGYGIHLTDGSDNEIYDNTLHVSTWLDRSDRTLIYENEFVNITGGSATYDESALIIASSNNTISDNTIDNVGIAFAFLPINDPNYNLVENNTLQLSSLQKSMEYYTSGMNNTFINTDISYVDISEDSYFEILHYVDIEMNTVLDSANNVELEITEGDSVIYATNRYNGSDYKTDSLGQLERLFIVSEIYDGDYVADSVITTMKYYYDSVEYIVNIDTDSSHEELIWVNLRPISSIESVSGIGDLPTSTEEAVKGADLSLVDENTIAYWPFDEELDLVLDNTGSNTGTISPIGIWSEENRPNTTNIHSVQFDGQNTKIETTLSMKDYDEFTVELWFKTNELAPYGQMTLISDKQDSLDQWGYNLYIDGFLKFDFTVDDGNVISVNSVDSVSDNEWHFVSVVRGPDYVELWLDGELIDSADYEGDIGYTVNNILIGQSWPSGNAFNGLMDDLRFSSIARHNEDFMTGSGVVTFISNSYDEDGQIVDYIWTSSKDGELGRGSVLYYPVDALTEGSHSIRLSVTDNNNTISDYSSYGLLVMQRPDSEIVYIRVNDESTAWGWGIDVNSGDEVSFKGRTNSEQFISTYSWVSDIDESLFTDGVEGVSEFSTTDLSNGTHYITFMLQGGNSLWSPEQLVEIRVNGRPQIGDAAEVSEELLDRLKSASIRVPIADEESSGLDLTYDVSYRVKGSEEWFTDYISDVSFNDDTGNLEFIFAPDAEAEIGEYEFFIGVTDDMGGIADYYIMNQGITVQNNIPEITETGVDVDGDGILDENPIFQEGDGIDLSIETIDADGSVKNYTWYIDIDADGEIDEDEILAYGQSPAKDEINYDVMEVGENEVTVVVTDDDGATEQTIFIIEVTAAPVEESAVELVLEGVSNNLPLIAAVSVGLVMVLGTIALRRNRSTSTEVEVISDDADPLADSRPEQEVEDWDIPTDAQGNALIIGEYMAKRRESYLSHPNNEEVLDYLHNNRERFTISSYFDVPADPTVVITDWALPENLRGNVHLDSFRQQLVERITNSTPDKNFVIIGEPGVGKTVMLFEVFDRLMYKSPVGILSTDTIAKAHEMFGVRVFYDDIPENQTLVEALTDNEISGVIVTSREADWKALPTEMQAKFDRLTVPLFSDLDMKQMIEKMMTFQSIGFNDESVDVLAEYAEGSPIYVWSMVREMMHRSVKSLSAEYIKENSVKGMINYVAQLLQRLLKDGEEYRDGGLHALASLIFLSDHMEERYCNDYFFDAYVEELSKHTEEKLGDKMNPKTLNLVLAYLPINDSVIRFPHDTWPDVLQGWGDMNPFSTELRMINRSFADSGLFQDLKKEVVSDVWKSTYERYKRTPSRQKNSFLALADTLFQNFTIDELKELGVDIDIVRQVASTYSHIPQAAKLISKIQAVLPQTVTRIINMQDIDSEKGHVPYKIQEMYLIYNDGRMITSLMDEEAKVDSDIMSSMLTAINDFVKDSFQTSGNLGSIDYGENQIILERGKHTILASVVYGEANRDLRSRMGRALTKIEGDFGSKLRSWDGDVDSLSDCVNYLQPVMDLSKTVTKDMIDELQALKDVSLKSSWSQVAGFVQVNLMLNNYSKKVLKGAKLTLEYGADFLKVVKTEPKFKYTVTEVDIKKVAANDEMAVTLYFEPLKSTQASLNVHLDYESKGGQSSGVSTAVFERVNLYKEGATLNIADIENAAKAEIVAEPVEVVEATAEVVEATVEDVEVEAEVVDITEVSSDVEVLDAVVEEAEAFETEAEVVEEPKKEEKKKEPEEAKHDVPDPGDSGVDDIMSKLGELDDPENKPKKKKDKSDEEEDKSGMDDVLGKLDEL